jgi:hypothetical protein
VPKAIAAGTVGWQIPVALYHTLIITRSSKGDRQRRKCLLKLPSKDVCVSTIEVELIGSPAAINRYMKRVKAKVRGNFREDPLTEPDGERNTCIIEAKLNDYIPGWETDRVGFHFSPIAAEILESSMAEPNTLTIRTRGQSPLRRGDVITVEVRSKSPG